MDRVERYVAGQLTPQEAAEFEEYLLEHPELIDQVEAARQLKLGLRTLADRGSLPEILQTRRRQPVQWLMAAGIAAAVVGAMFLSLRPAPELLAASIADLSSSLHQKAVAGEYLLVRTRGQPVEIALPKEPAPIAVSLVMPRNAGNPVYDVSLACGGKNLSTTDGLRTNPEGAVVVFLDPSTLAAGPCEFNASSGADNEVFPIRFVSPRD